MSEENAPESSARKRNITADLVKGVAIAGTVVFHLALIQTHGSESVTTTGVGIMTFKPIVYSMLCTFIVISGYFYVSKRSFIWNVKHRIVKFTLYLVGAIVILNSLMYGILWLQGGYDLDISQLWEVIWQNLIGRNAFKTFEETHVYGGIIFAPFEVTNQLYYLQMIIVGYLIFYAIVDKVIDDPRKLFAAVFILMTISAVLVEYVGIVLPFYAHLGPMAAGFLLIGTYLSRIRFFEWLESGVYDKKYWLTFLALLIVSASLCFITPRDASILYCNFGPFGGWSLLTFVVLSATGGLMLSFVISWIRYIKYLRTAIAQIGLSCISVYVLHMFVAKCLAAPFVTFNTEVWMPLSAIWGIILAAITVTIITLASYWFRTYKARSRSE